MSKHNKSVAEKISIAIPPADGVAGTTDINGATLDMLGWDSVMMVVTFGAITSTAVTVIKAQGGAESDLSDAADLIGTGQTIADDDDEKTFYIDLNPLDRYNRLVVDRGTANAVVASAYYIQYNGDKSKLPVTHGTGVAGELHHEPIAGTA